MSLTRSLVLSLVGLCCCYESAVGQEVGLLPPQERPELLQLFDGRSLDDWLGDAKVWSVRNGELVGVREDASESETDLRTERRFEDFRMLGEVRLVAGDKFAVVFGGAPQGEFNCDGRAVEVGRESAGISTDEWAQWELLVIGQRVRLAINGKVRLDERVAAASKIDRGLIALRLLASQERQEVRWRKLVVETFPDERLQTVLDDLPPPIVIQPLERNVDPDGDGRAIERWTTHLEAIVPDELLRPTRGTRLPLTSLGVREVEREAYYALVQKARELPLPVLHQAASEWREARKALPASRRLARKPGAEFPQFVDLFRNPTDYHGKLVTLTGHVRKLVEMPADQNPYGIERLYEAWFFDEHSQSNPSVVICTSLDPRLKPEPETLIDHCRVTGYFFKNMAYDGQRDLRFAPLLIGQKLEYFPPPPAELGWLDRAMNGLVRATGMPRGVIGVVTIGIGCLVSLLVIVRLRKRAVRRPKVVSPTVAPSFEKLVDRGTQPDFSRLEGQASGPPSKPNDEA